jgi:hypothetical protein
MKTKYVILSILCAVLICAVPYAIAETCSACSGSGDCQTCGGDGSDWLQTCSNCGGTGRCSTCGGDGQVSVSEGSTQPDWTNPSDLICIGVIALVVIIVIVGIAKAVSHKPAPPPTIIYQQAPPIQTTCPYCGTPHNSNFCPNCGNRR